MTAPVDFTLGGNANDAMQLTMYVEDISNPNAFGQAFVTMQTTEGLVVSCG
jgi:hypothetical protein